eukprot:TRINITY_DN8322_c0_g1_i1.p1 TRINITY_DN8322_c0_g1~~TRINITY_DN8322_c0_g1_i1.p1  ORF type:complete len:389 (-),score=100.24 TRINITY_DN8322_c0_g1_i1:84-1250(-)
MAQSQKTTMEYRRLGNSGLNVSVVAFGNWLTANTLEFQQTQNEIVKAAYDAGINYFDTAEVYGSGLAETQLGISLKALGVPRQDYVVSTKMFKRKDGETDPRLNSDGLSRKKIIESATNSLKRLQLDYVDIFFAHRYDHETPLEETVRAFAWLVQTGKTLYWGTSEWKAEHILEVYGICDRLNLPRPVVEQPQYNLLFRQQFEVDYGTLFDNFGMGSTVWSPLASGFLTGKYLDGIPADSRLAKDPWITKIFYPAMDGDKAIETNKKLRALSDYSKTLGISMAQLCLCWILKNQDVSSVLLGVSRVSQLDENIKAVELYKTLGKEVYEKVEEIVGTRPTYPLNCRTWKPLPPRVQQISVELASSFEIQKYLEVLSFESNGQRKKSRFK